MDFTTTKSGLAVPAEPPPPAPPARKMGLLEIREPERRVQAEKALSDLWDAMELSSGGGGIDLSGKPDGLYDAHYSMWDRMACDLLGRYHMLDKEVLC